MARPTDNLDEVMRFYIVGLGLEELGSFEDHDGFDGMMVGVFGASAATIPVEHRHRTTSWCSISQTRKNGRPQ